MAKYRKKPVVIEAEQFFANKKPWPADVFEHETYSDSADFGGRRLLGEFAINTLEGRHIVTDGDFIITGVQGEIYPCKPDIFEQTYERVDDDCKHFEGKD